MYEFWCGVILRDVRSAILTTHQNEYIIIFLYPTNNLFITYALLSQKAFWLLLYIFHQQNLKNNICIKQTKTEIQNERKTIVAIFVSKAGTYYECVFKGISFINLRAPANFHLYYLYLNRGFGIKCST